ncbi:MAG: NapC/NirT family cytochrome c [Candidatus Thiodiazotropha sp.]|jgi:cytochrome c-type protein NapC
MFRDRPAKQSVGKISIILAGLIFVAGMVFTGLFNMGLSYTNEMAFCTSCHSMKVNLEEYKETIHFKNASGVRATCSDCHVPKPFIPKMLAKVMAAKDIYHEILGTIDTKEKYEAHRWDMANRVWKKMRASNSRECRSCHDYTNMDLSLQDRSARKRHPRALDEGKACIDCHAGIAHEEPDEPETADEQ